MTKASRHDRIYNEGGEGYNPHHDDDEWAPERGRDDIVRDIARAHNYQGNTEAANAERDRRVAKFETELAAFDTAQ